MKNKNLNNRLENNLYNVSEPVIDFNYRWYDAPIEMKEAFANEHKKNLNDYIHEYDLMNMWYAKRYFLGIDD